MTKIDEDGLIVGSDDDSGVDWPPVDVGVRYITSQERANKYGTFTYVARPIPGNPEAIQITGMKNFGISRVIVPQSMLDRKVPGIVHNGVYVNEKLVDQMSSLFSDWENEGLLDLLLTWDGAYAPRFVRGSKTTLSNHSWGTAFDINAAWNPLGKSGAVVGEKGSVRKLVSLAVKNGFYWGGGAWGSGRIDCMHFEAGVLV